jgi:hypothetical protein
MSHPGSHHPEKPPYALELQTARGWQWQVNAIPVEDLLQAHASVHQHAAQSLQWITATNAQVGITYTYGLHPNALPSGPYDGMWKREYGGGGSVVAAYVEEPETRQIFVGMLWQRRALHMANGPVLAVPRGFAAVEEQKAPSFHFSPDELKRIHQQTALMELTEEMVEGQFRLEMLEQLGPPVNMNNADVDTAGEGEGVYFYRIELPWSYVEAISPGVLVLKTGREATHSMQEGILRCQFRELSAVVALLDDAENAAAGCAFTEIAIGRLARYFQRKGYVLFS